jgi:hypothetical protein
MNVILILLVLLVLPAAAADSAATKISEIDIPYGFSRVSVPADGFAAFLRDLPLQPTGTPVTDFRGKNRKTADDTSLYRVVNYPIRGRRNHQCMDIIIRLFSDFLYRSKRQENLVLPLPGGFRLAWRDWAAGYRPVFQGLAERLEKQAAADSSQGNYRSYLELVFAESGTQQFYYFLPQVNPDSVTIGDIWIKKGSRGHAVLVVDMITGPDGAKRIMVAQGDTPACDLHILRYRDGTPWFPLQPSPDLPIRKKMTADGIRRLETGLIP